MFKRIKFSGYKSFPRDIETNIEEIGYMNLFIGKNNSGKSSALDIVAAAFCANERRDLPTKPLMLQLGYEIEDSTISKTQHSYHYEPTIMQKYRGQYFWIEPKLQRGYSDSNANFTFDYDRKLNLHIENANVNWHNYFFALQKPDYRFLRISAERNIVPEQASSDELRADGTGATNLIRKIVNHKEYDERLIEEKLLCALNQIMGDDAHFESIRVQEIGSLQKENDSKWEVFLQEKGSQRFPLSQSGSGLKTIILVLLNLLVIPEVYSNKKCAYGFEELENNLHPALQRRLYEFIYKHAVENKTPVFLTTHSHVAINMFFEKQNASLYHVTKSEYTSAIKRIDNYVHKAEILDDLDVKASDLLQANGIIWVEGPSDRVYVKRWIELFGGTDICEGVDYQFAYYGGRLLSHYSTEENCDGLISILLINRNSAIIVDSDKRSRNGRINDTKKRIQNEFEEKGLFVWITKGKEIENYLCVNALKRAFNAHIPEQCGQFELFPDYISKYYTGFTSKKVLFANKVKDSIDTENVLDLELRVKKLYQTISAWNK